MNDAVLELGGKEAWLFAEPVLVPANVGSSKNLKNLQMGKDRWLRLPGLKCRLFQAAHRCSSPST